MNIDKRKINELPCSKLRGINFLKKQNSAGCGELTPRPAKGGIKVKHLKKSDVVGIVAPAYSVDRHSFYMSVEKLKKMGFKVKYSRSMFKKYCHMAGIDKERAGQINSMFADRSVKAIFCANAGHGSFRVLPYLDKKIISKNPKIFVGYSDITILLCYLQRITNMVVFHGPVLCGEIHQSMNYLTEEYLIKAIGQSSPMEKLAFRGVRILRHSKAAGILTGGNLAMIANSIGTPYEIDTKGKILFLEDINESLEEIDNYFMQLKLAGKFSSIRGLILGKMIGCGRYSARSFDINKIIDNILADK
jgi:muramoyltetrapeptide carboxypeptidase